MNTFTDKNWLGTEDFSADMILSLKREEPFQSSRDEEAMRKIASMWVQLPEFKKGNVLNLLTRLFELFM